MRYSIADIHCHPNLKPFGHSFYSRNRSSYNNAHVWFYDPPGIFSKCLNALTGLTKFRQTDFSTMAKANVRLAFVSLYPFEKGFFHPGPLNSLVAANLANFITGIGVERIRHLQKHTNYYEDLCNEYEFLKNSCKKFTVDAREITWQFVANARETEQVLETENGIAVIPTIEGAHVFNTGLQAYGKMLAEEMVLQHVDLLKQWDYPPFFITFAHNFNNDLCGHARSLERLGKLVDQQNNLDAGFSPLGLKVLHALLSTRNGRPIYIDIKHMSLRARIEYFDILKSEYNDQIPVIVSHGAVTGTSLHEKGKPDPSSNFCRDDINFFDEELVKIAQTGGLFGLQLDSCRLTKTNSHHSLLKSFSRNAFEQSVDIVWQHIKHIAEVLDQARLFGWGHVSIGSDFDGTINPLNGIWTAENYQMLAEHLVLRVETYLQSNNPLQLPENKNISAQEVVERFVFRNVVDFVYRYY